MKTVRAFLTTVSVGGNPTSEAAYKSHLALIDVAMPNNGGLLQADGTWLQPAFSNFELALPELASSVGQQYVPVMNPGTGTDKVNMMAVLDDPDLQDTAADGIVTLATTRFDATWDGVAYDACYIPAAYVTKHETFLEVIAGRLQVAGLPFQVIRTGWIPGYADRVVGYSTIASVAGSFDHYMYNWTDSVGPYWWAENRIMEGVGTVSDSITYLGIGTFCRYWPVTGVDTNSTITHAAAMQLVYANDSTVEWVESDVNGLVREQYATVGAGHIWLSDGDTVSARLTLADDCNLPGVMLYSPGMSDETVWQAVARWKSPTRAATRLHLVAAQEED